jgi:acetate kinase
MSKVLVINCGSSSLKYQLIDMDNEQLLAKGLCERIGIEGSLLTHKPVGKEPYVDDSPLPDHKVAVTNVLKALVDPEHGVIKSVDEIAAIGHRVLHGGTKYSESIIVNDDVKKVIRECFDLGPLHNPANLIGIEAAEAAMPGKPNVAVFDTAFGMAMPEKAYMYAIPHEYYEKYGIRRYGFHGTSHMFVSHEALKFLDLDPEKGRVIVCHLGNGSSVSASVGGKCVDTSMGLTPLEGLIMGTRSGDVDPAVLQFIMNHEHIDINEMLNILNKKSGYLGMTDGLSSDNRDVAKAAKEGNHLAQVAISACRYRVAKYIGAYTAAMNGTDAIVFTGGIGENDVEFRKEVCDFLDYLGITIDDEKNSKRGERLVISTPDSKIKVAVIPTNEELAIARETKRLTHC